MGQAQPLPVRQVVDDKTEEYKAATSSLAVSHIKRIKQRKQSTQTNKIAPIFTSLSYVAILEAVTSLIGQKCYQPEIFKEILPHVLAISEVEIGALLAVANFDADLPQPLSNFTVMASQGVPQEVAQALTQGQLAQQLAAGKPLWIEPKPLALDTQRALLGRHKLHYLFGLPLYYNNRVLGAVVVSTQRSQERLLRPELHRRLTMLTQILALFLDNMRLRTTKQAEPENKNPDELEQLLAAVMSAEEEVVSQNTDLGLLNAFSSEVGSTLQLTAILQKAIERTRAALNVAASWCYLQKDSALVLCEQQGLSEQYVKEMSHLAPTDGVEGMAFSRTEPILRDAVLFHSGKARKLVQAEKLRTVAAMPLVVEDKTIGVLAVGKTERWSWSTRDKRMLNSIAGQLAQAISNSQMFNEIKEKAQSWEASYSQLQQVNKQLVQRTESLEQQITELRQAEHKIWLALAASTEARHTLTGQNGPGLDNEQLASSLKKALVKLKN